ncbi:MAG: class I adenylate-forming enzyme family protein, partial [Granulosicoccaceae bacterium]
QRTAKRVPEAPALMCGEHLEANYAEFAARAASVGKALQTQYGVRAGDRVVIFMHNHTRYLEIMYGIWAIGAVAVPVNAKLHLRELAWIIENAEASLVTCSQSTAESLAAVMLNPVQTLSVDTPEYAAIYCSKEELRPAYMHSDDLLWLFYTSGTTGRPKGVMISCSNVLAMCGSYYSDADHVCAQDAALYAAPMSHGAGIYNFMHVQRGARHIVPASGGFDEAEIFALATAQRNISMFAAPTMVKRLVDYAKIHACSGDGIKTIVYGGGPMYLADICEAVDVLGDRFVQIYGQGECPMAISALPRELVSDRTHPRWRERLASVGMAQSCVNVRIASSQGEALAAGEIGEILVSGVAVMKGYWRNPEATAETIRGGWLWTGDMGSVDEDGFLTMQDRSKDMIISGGSNIYPREVEEALLLHRGVQEVSVVGKPHPEWGEEVVAFVVIHGSESVDEQELDKHCLENIARFKRPKHYHFVGELPKNNYGKVLKTELRERL